MTALHIVTPPLGSTSADLPWICSRLLRPAGPERTPAPRGQPPALNQRVTCPPARVTAGRRTSDGDSTGLQYPLAGRRRVGTEGKRMPRTPRMTDTLRGKTLVYLGAGLAVAGAGAATATAGFAGTREPRGHRCGPAPQKWGDRLKPAEACSTCYRDRE